jgi:hypothetical protein
MAYNRNHARRLLTADELELFLASLPDKVDALDQAGLRTAIGRARKLRDKYRDLHRRQATASRGRTGARGKAAGENQRTEQKATIFVETLSRFEARLERLERDEQRAARQATLAAAGARRSQGPPTNRAERRAQAASARGKGRSGGASGFVTDAAKGARNRKVVSGPTAKHISAHRSAAGRRSQAKRDSR